MAIPIDLTPGQEKKLRDEAKRLGVSAEALAQLAVEDLLDRPEADFERATQLVMEKNQELYDRLS
jgi:hypothetical protein